MAAGRDDDVRREQLQAEVRRLKTRSGRYRSLPRLLNVGVPGGARLVVPLTAAPRPLPRTVERTVERAGERAGDDGLAADVVTRALDRMGRPGEQTVWLTRSGSLEAGDDDWRWRAGAAVARQRYGVDPGQLYVVTRHGWLELPSGRRRTWRRMRPTWSAPYDDVRDDPQQPDPVEGWPVGF